MRKMFFASVAAAALLVAAPALAQDDATEFDLGPDGESAVGIGDKVSASDIMKDSDAEEWLIDAVVTSEDGAAIGTIESCEYDETDHLQTLVIKATDGELYDLPAEDATFDASAGMVTTNAVFADLERHRNALEEFGDALEDALDSDAPPEDRGPDHHPDENDIDDPDPVGGSDR